jgi:hypothetical protein
MNKSLFTIDPSEKQRILEMHQSATRKQYLGEQSVPTPAPTPAPKIEKAIPVSVNVPFMKITDTAGQMINSKLTMNVRPKGTLFEGDNLTILFEQGVYVIFRVSNNVIGDNNSAAEYLNMVNGTTNGSSYVEVGQYNNSTNKKRTITYVNDLISNVNTKYNLNLTLDPRVAQVITQTTNTNAKTEKTFKVGPKQNVTISVRQNHDVETDAPIGSKNLDILTPDKVNKKIPGNTTIEKQAQEAVTYLNTKKIFNNRQELDSTYNQILTQLK